MNQSINFTVNVQVKNTLSSSTWLKRPQVLMYLVLGVLFLVGLVAALVAWGDPVSLFVGVAFGTIGGDASVYALVYIAVQFALLVMALILLGLGIAMRSESRWRYKQETLTLSGDTLVFVRHQALRFLVAPEPHSLFMDAIDLSRCTVRWSPGESLLYIMGPAKCAKVVDARKQSFPPLEGIPERAHNALAIWPYYTPDLVAALRQRAGNWEEK